MSETTAISKNRTLPSSQDYEVLRELGMEYVRTLAGAVWTDHNLHDPGITTLEALCYALTDLGYRAAFPIADLLTGDDGKLGAAETTTLFPAHEILPCAPLTISDYRRLLLRLEGVRNAWLDPMMDPSRPGFYKESEVPLYIECAGGKLTYDETSATTQVVNERLRLSGLYRVLLDLETDDTLGSLNDRVLAYRVPRGDLKNVVLWIDAEQPELSDGTVDLTRKIATVTVDSVTAGATETSYTAVVRVELGDESEIVLDPLEVNVNDDPDGRLSGKSAAAQTALIGDALSDTRTDGPVQLFWLKLRARRRALCDAACVLHAHRALCEDFLSIDVVGLHNLAICADVEVMRDADLEEVQAAVFHAIENVLNPPINRYSLAELLAEGMSPDDIFNGPRPDPGFTCAGERVLTRPGFIKQEDLDASELPGAVHASDLINAVMDIPGVVAVRNIQLRTLDSEGRPSGPSERWVLPIDPGKQPCLIIERSKLLFYKDGLPFQAELSEFEDALERLRALSRKSAYVDPDETLDVPTGTLRALDAFYSIQDDFPQTYGIGGAGLPATASVERVAQARQFKGYLLFFDQLLADYLAQLAAARRLLSLEQPLTSTYFSQYLTSIAGVRDPFADEFYVDAPALQDEGARARLIEDESLFQERRNAFLDHLLARFAERFADYAMMVMELEGGTKAGDTLIGDKIAFLAEYPVVSRDRYRAFNQYPETDAAIWDSDNVSGLERRAARLLGIDDYTRRDLACAALFDLLFSSAQVSGTFRVQITRDGEVLFTSMETFTTSEAALAAAWDVYPGVRLEATYRLVDVPASERVRFALGFGGRTLTHEPTFETEAEAYAAIRAIISRHDELLGSGACEDEGMHLIEHILLRPRRKDDARMGACVNCAQGSCGDEDPYSFRISVVLPYWPTRFQDLDFRRFVERTIREETPAHIHARICWISNEQMAELDERHRAWREALAHRADLGGADLLSDAAADLIDILGRLRTVYPAATLHDCEDDGDDGNVVRLDSTNLGIF